MEPQGYAGGSNKATATITSYAELGINTDRRHSPNNEKERICELIIARDNGRWRAAVAAQSATALSSRFFRRLGPEIGLI